MCNAKKTWIILPFDNSPAARAALHHAARQSRDPSDEVRHHGVMLAVAGVDPEALICLAGEARAIAGPDVLLELRLLSAGDPIGDFRRLAAAFPDAALAAPLGVSGRAPWFAEACRFAGLDHPLVLFFIRPKDLESTARALRQAPTPHGLGSAVHGLARRGAGVGRALAGVWPRPPVGNDAENRPIGPATSVATATEQTDAHATSGSGAQPQTHSASRPRQA